MNTLSWFLYATDALGNIKFLCGAILCGTAIMWGILNASVLVTEGEITDWPPFGKWWTRGVVVMIVTGIVFAVLPSKNTMYAIATSQVGEQVAKSETVQGIATDATKALQAWIKQQLEPDAKK